MKKVCTNSDELREQSHPSVYNLSLNTGSLDQSGLTPHGMIRIFIVALLVFGQFVGSLFQAQPVSAADNVRLPAPIVSEPSGKPKTSVVSSCSFNFTNGIEPLKGIGGEILGRVGSGLFDLPINVKLYDGNTLVGTASSDNPDVGRFRFDSVNPAPAGKLLTIEFDPSSLQTGDNYLKSYFNYFTWRNDIGRYDRSISTRVYLDDGSLDAANTCVAYAEVDPAAVSTAFARTIPGVGVVNLVTMTDAITPDRAFSVRMAAGRGLGGRLFTDNGSNSPPPLFNGSVSIDLHQVVSNTLVITPLLTAAADREGYYSLAGSTASGGSLPRVQDGTYALRFRDEIGVALDSFYCNYVFTSSLSTFSPINFSNLALVTFTVAQVQNQYLTEPTDPKAFNTTPPCKAATPSSLAIPGFHQVLKSEKFISGTVTYATDSAPAVGAIVVAIPVTGSGQIRQSDPVDSSGRYTISVEPGRYYVQFQRPNPLPANRFVVSEYYNNIAIDQPEANRTIVDTSAGVAININAQLDPGWFFAGTVNLFGGVGNREVEVSVYRTLDLNLNNPQPVDVVQINPTTGLYQTNPLLSPGISYSLAFRPYNNNYDYTSAWCGPLTGSTCSSVPAADSAFIFNVTSANDRVNGIQADITLVKGAVFSGSIAGRNPGSATDDVDLGALNTSVAVYVYKVTLAGSTIVSSSLAQLFNVAFLTPPLATYAYTTTALFTNTNYVIKYVSINPPGDPGFRAAYYNSTQITGTTVLTTAEVINKPTSGLFSGYNVSLVRAGGIRAAVFNRLGQPFPGIRVEARAADGQIINSATTNQFGQAEVIGLGIDGNNYTILFSQPGRRGLAIYTPTLALVAGQMTPISYTYVPVAVGGRITPSNLDWTSGILRIWRDNGNTNRTLYAQCVGASLDPQGQPTCAGGILRDEQTQTWRWEASLPTNASYFFEIVSTNSLYVSHWYVGPNELNGANPEVAVSVLVLPDTDNSNLNINFVPGGVVRVHVQGPNFVPEFGAQTGFYTTTADRIASPSRPIFITEARGTLPSGNEYSRPNTAISSLVIQVYPRDDSPLDEGFTPNPVPVIPGRYTYVTITLQYAPIVTGFVRIRQANNSELPFAGALIIPVDTTTGNAVSSVRGTSNFQGYYSFRMPVGQFRIAYQLPQSTGFPIRYWINTAQQTGTPELGQATIFERQPGRRFSNVNMIFDQSVSYGCRVTDAYMLRAGLTDATIRYFTNCAGNTQLGWNQASPRPTATNILSYTNSLNVNENVYTHTATMTNLLPDTNYYVRPFSRLTMSSTQTIASEVELLVRTGADGRTWYFANGTTRQSTPTSLVTTTQILSILNPDAGDANITISYYTQTGATVGIVTRQLSVRGTSRVDVPVTDATNPLSLAVTGFNGTHSTKVTSDKRVVVERFEAMAGRVNGNAFNGGYSLLGANSGATSLYFPEVNVNPNRLHQIHLFNPNPSPTCVSLDYYGGPTGFVSKPNAQTTPPQFLQIPANGRLSFSSLDGNYAPIPAGSYSLKINTYSLNRPELGILCQRLPIIAEQETRYSDPTFRNAFKGYAGHFATPAASQRWNFVDGQSDKPFDVNYIIFNNYNTAAVLTITASIDNPISGNVALFRQVTVTVPANQRVDYSVPFATFNAAAPGRRFGYSSKIDSSVPVIVQRDVKYVYSSSPVMQGMFQELGALRASSKWLFATGTTRYDLASLDFNEETLHVYNPNPYETNLKITYIFTDTLTNRPPGVTPPKVYTTYRLGAYGRAEIQPSVSDGPTNTYPSVGINKAIGVLIESTDGTGIIAERTIYYRKGGTNGGNAMFGWNPPGS